MLQRLSDSYRSHFIVADSVGSVGVGISVAIAIECLAGAETVSDVLAGNRAALYAAVASVGGALLGFAIALIPISIALLSLEALSVVRRSPHIVSLFHAFLSAILWLAFLTIGALVALLLDRDTAPHVEASYGVLILVTGAAWTLTSAVHLMWRLLRLTVRGYAAEAGTPSG